MKRAAKMSTADSTIRDIERIFNARSIAIVGASNDLGKFGGMTLDTVVRAGYTGRIYPVNPKAEEIQGIKSYTSLAKIPGPVDVVLVIVPAKFVSGILVEAVEKGAKGAVVMSAGFRESGNVDLENEILSVAKKHGLRMLGPNIQGFNYVPNKLCAMFMPVIDTEGPIAVITQSGSVTAVLSEWLADEGMGISGAVNLGNQADLCEADYLNFFSQDEHTRAIVMYIESVKDGSVFFTALKRAAAVKPVCIYKAGRTEAGALGAASHTGTLAGNHQVFSKACRQFGAVVTADLETLFDQVKAAATLGNLKGRRIAFVSSSGGANNIAVDEAVSRGFEIPHFPPELIEELKELPLSPLAHLDNPVDLGSVHAEQYRDVALKINQFGSADLLLINFADPMNNSFEAVNALAAEVAVPVAVSYMGGGRDERSTRIKLQQAGIPVFSSPARAIRGIEAVAWMKDYRNRRGLD